MVLKGNVFSRVLGTDVGITVVTPRKIIEGAPYQVAYLLHGLCGSNASWAEQTMLPYYAEKGSTVYILPEGGRSFYVDMEKGYPYFTYLTEELPEMVRQLFRISAKREDTIIMGGSMGGYGALRCALLLPERYGLCCAFASAALYLGEYLESQRGQKELEIPDFPLLFGEGLVCKAEQEISFLAAKSAKREVQVPIYLSCGTRDLLLPEHRRFAAEAQEMGLALYYEELEGTHDWKFFDSALEKAIKRYQL